MSSNVHIINFSDLLERHCNQFLASRIFRSEKDLKTTGNVKRPLTNSEKQKIIESYFIRYWVDFFQNEKKEKPHFILGKIKLVNRTGKPYTYWTDYPNIDVALQLNISLENVASNLISNLTLNYERTHDIESLDHYPITVKNE